MEILIGFGGVILGSILTLVREFWSESRTKKQRASYLSVRVVGKLEKFIDGCTDVVSDDGYEDEQGCSRPAKSCPSIEFDSLEVDWQALPFDLMYEIINFPSSVADSDGYIDSVVEYVAYPPDYSEFFEEREFQYSKLGLIANDLSTRLRQKYNMPTKNYGDWDPIGHLIKSKEKIEEIRSRREIEHQKMWAAHNNSSKRDAVTGAPS
jgi:hypothetical protein